MKNNKEHAETRQDQLKEHINKTKEVLEVRIDQTIQIEDKITVLSEEFNKNKQVHEEFRRKMIDEISKCNS